MPATRRQTAAAKTSGAGSATATFAAPTLNGSCLVLVAMTYRSDTVFVAPAGFGSLGLVTVGPAGGGPTGVRMQVWTRNSAPVTTSLKVSTSTAAALVVRAVEYRGVADPSLDQFAFTGSLATNISVGPTAVTAQADELWFVALGNSNSSVAQSGHTPGFVKLADDVSPATGDVTKRVRLVALDQVRTATGAAAAAATLSKLTGVYWTAGVVTLKGTAVGPVRFVANGPLLSTGGSAVLTAFGPLTANGPLLTVGGSAELSFFDYQYRLNGVFIGDGTPYDVVSVQGLEGFAMRVGDSTRERGDGAIRGSDWQEPRTIVFTLEVVGDAGTVATTATQKAVEANLAALQTVLGPRRDEDWELVWQHPGRPTRRVVCRPVLRPRQLEWRSSFQARVEVTLRASSPLITSYARRSVTLPSGGIAVVQNAGDVDAYPRVTVTPPTTGVCTGVVLNNRTLGVELDIVLAVEAGEVLVADMDAAAYPGPVSVISLGGQPQYGAWQLPRVPFPIGPGLNELAFTASGSTAGVAAVVEWRDTWPG